MQGDEISDEDSRALTDLTLAVSSTGKAWRDAAMSRFRGMGACSWCRLYMPELREVLSDVPQDIRPLAEAHARAFDAYKAKMYELWPDVYKKP